MNVCECIRCTWICTLLQELSAREMQLTDLATERASAIQQLHEAQAHEKKLTGEMGEATHRRLEHRRFRPGILEILFSLGKAFREWRAKDKILEILIEQAERNLTEARNQATIRQQEVASLDQQIPQTAAAIEQQRQLLAAARENLNTAKARFGAYVPLPDTWDKEVQARELSSPWADPEWNEARARVFIERGVHKAFMSANAETMRKSLQGAMDVLAGAVPETAEGGGCLDSALLRDSGGVNYLCFLRSTLLPSWPRVAWLAAHR